MKQAVFLLAGTFGVGIIIYTAKSLYTQVIKLKRRSGIISSIDYLLNQITEQKGKLKGLQYYQRMLIIGRPQIMDLQSPSLLAIFRQKNYNECDPIFKFNSSFKQHILVNDFNQNLQSIQRKELELSQFCECQKIEFNPQNVKYVLFGDFIYNPDNNLLRCTRIREFSSFWYHCRSRSSKELFHRLLILLKLGTIVGLIYFLIVLYKNLQQMQESNAKKGFNPQYPKKLSCRICKIRKPNIVFQPCFHFNCCQICAQNIMVCPSCKQYIQKSEKVYNI